MYSKFCWPQQILVSQMLKTVKMANDWLLFLALDMIGYTYSIANSYIISKHSIMTEEHHRNQPNKNKLVLYKLLLTVSH